MIYDLIIIGAGPAGITAAVYAARKRMNFIVITNDIGGQTGWSGDIENYTGYQFITGPELVNKFEEHMRKYDITVKENEPALDIIKNDDILEEAFKLNSKKSVNRKRRAVSTSPLTTRGMPPECRTISFLALRSKISRWKQ